MSINPNATVGIQELLSNPAILIILVMWGLITSVIYIIVKYFKEKKK